MQEKPVLGWSATVWLVMLTIGGAVWLFLYELTRTVAAWMF
jgi:hypothetical protein